MAPERQVTQPTQVRVRRVALGTGPGQVTVLGQSFVPAWDLGGRQGWVSGTIERRLYEEGVGTLRLANAAGADGQRHIDRLRCLTDAGFAPGDEWFEVWEDTDLLGVWTPTGSQRVTRSDIQLSGEDAASLLKRTRETTVGYWCQAPRDVIEHYGRAWRALIAEGFDTGGPAFTYSVSPQTTPDGAWNYTRCETDQSVWPGAVRLRNNGAYAVLASTATFTAGTGAADRYRPWRAEVDVLPGPVAAGEAMAFHVWDGTTNLAAINILYDQATFSTSLVTSGFGNRVPITLSASVPLKLSMEGRDRWVFFTINGRVACILPMGSVSNPVYVQVDGPSNNGSALQVRSVSLRVADRLLVNDRAGDYRLPGVPAPGGLWGEYVDANDLVAAYGAGIASQIMLNPTRDPVASRLEAGLNYTSANPPAWRPQGVPQDYFAARYTGSIYLDLDNADYAVRVTCDDEATVWVGRTRGGEHVAYATGAPGVGASNWLKAGSSSGSAPSGTTGPLAGMRSGWYPIVVEFKQVTGSGGIVFEWESSGAVGTWTTVPPAKLSPYGVHRTLVRNESHYDALKAAADVYGYQWTCEPRSLESGEFPGRIVPRVRVGRDTEKRLGESEATDLAAELDLDTRADALQADASGISDPAAGAQLTAEMLNYRAAGAHLIVTADYESLADITSPQLLEQRLTTLLALRASPWQTVAARPPGRRELLDAWPLTGTLAEFQWAPGDGIRLDLPTVGVVDTAPRQILGVTRDYTPNGLAPPVAAFRPRPRSIVAALRDLRRAALQPQRNYQQQLAQTAGSVGSQGAYVGGADDYSRLALPPPDRVVSLFLVVLAKSDASAWTIAMNGASTPIVVTAPGRYDVTAFATANPSGYNIGRLVTGGTGTGDWLVRLEATVRV